MILFSSFPISCKYKTRLSRQLDLQKRKSVLTFPCWISAEIRKFSLIKH
jgi:hypothetical protein